MVLSLIFLGVEMRGQIFTFGEYGFVSDVFRSRDERSDFHYW